MREGSTVETRGKARQDKALKEEIEELNGVVTRPKRGRPRKTETVGNEESEEGKEEINGESDDSHKKTKQLKHIHDAADEEMVTDEEAVSSKTSVLDFEEFVKQLRKSVPIVELKVLLEENGVDTYGSDEKLYQRSADLLYHGTCQSCPSCGGVLEFAGQTYECSGYSSEWAKCSFSTNDGRKGGKAKVPSKLKNSFLKKWVKSHEVAVRELNSADMPLLGMTFVLGGRMFRPQGEIRLVVEAYGGKVVNAVRKGVTAVIAPADEFSRGGSSKVVDALHLSIPVCKEAWLTDSIEKMQAQPLDSYNMSGQVAGQSDVIPWDKRAPEDEAEASLEAEVKLVGKRGIYKDANAEIDGGKILELDGIIYNCALSVCDIHIDLNQYAILQLIAFPVKTRLRNKRLQDLYLYVKEGRVGDRLGVRQRFEHFESTEEAVAEFSKVFQELTGNEFSNWQLLKTFHKIRNKFFPIDMGPGIDARAGGLDSSQLGITAMHSHLDSRVVDFLKILFSQSVYRYALLELGVDAPDLPIGNLSDWHLEFCYQYLVEFSEFLKSGEEDEQVKEKACLEFSNKWFTLLHSTRPFIIHDISQLAELAAPILETVRDISLASTLIGDMTDSIIDDPFTHRYNKLDCELTPLDRDGDDYKLIEKYFNDTMEPLKHAHGEFHVIMEDVVHLESKATISLQHIENFSNKKLLWSGNRTSNIVATLHRGMLPALIDAPAPLYSFGKGFYTTDAASKAAQYGFTSVDRPEGFLLLSIVALGDDVVELPSPVKPVREYEVEGISVKILGKKAPTEEVEWKYGVHIPAGPLTETKAEGVRDYMDFNEYVVYNSKQIKPFFLVKIRFDHVRRGRGSE